MDRKASVGSTNLLAHLRAARGAARGRHPSAALWSVIQSGGCVALEVLLSGETRRGMELLLELRERWSDSSNRRVRAARHLEAAVQILITQAVRSCSEFIKVTRVSVPQPLPVNA